MKKFSLVVAAFQLIAISSFAQAGKNVVKVNLSGLAIRSYAAQYERQVAPRVSVALGFSYIPEGSLPFPSYIDDLVDNPNIQLGKYTLENSVITPEVRYYFGKKGALSGFYLAPYARISTYNMGGPVNFQGNTGQKEANFTGKLNNVTGGLMMGSQFRLSNRLTLDWWILGASVGSAKGNLLANVQLDPLEQQNLKNVLESIEIPLTEIESDVNSNGARVNTTGTMVGVRGLGINLGFRF